MIDTPWVVIRGLLMWSVLFGLLEGVINRQIDWLIKCWLLIDRLIDWCTHRRAILEHKMLRSPVWRAAAWAECYSNQTGGKQELQHHWALSFGKRRCTNEISVRLKVHPVYLELLDNDDASFRIFFLQCLLFFLPSFCIVTRSVRVHCDVSR